MSFKLLARIAATLCFAILALPAHAAGDPYKIVGFGDSLMAGYGLDAGQSFPEQLEKALKERGHDVVIVNAGVSGDTSSGGLARLDWSVPDGTQMVILELGANDMLRGIEPQITKQNLDDMIGRLQQKKITVVLAGMRAAPNLGPDYQAAFDAIFPDLAAKYGVTLYPFFLDGVAGEPVYQLEDGMHPNAAGVGRMVDRAMPVIEPVIAADKQP
jgi:acyl-CoA thioesterase I